jgi:hypothetical protein
VSQVDFSVVENNAPLKTFTLQKRASDGTLSAVDLSSAVVHLYIKTSVRTTDADASTVHYSSPSGGITIQAPATLGKVDIQFQATHLATAGKKSYHLDVVIGGNSVTYAYGTITIQNV